MRAFKFSKRMQYDTVYEPGQVIDHLPFADTENLRLGGFGDYVEPVEESAHEEERDATDPATGDDQANAGGEGSDGSSAPPADPQPETFTCEACDGRVFANASGLSAHNRAKHA